MEKIKDISTEMRNPLQMARNAIFCSNCKYDWNRNKSKYEQWRKEDGHNA